MRVRGLAFLVTLAGALALVSAPGPASACGCGLHVPYLVAHGVSLEGIPWRIRAGEETTRGPQPRSAIFLFLVGRTGESNDAGYGIGMSLPISHRFVITGTAGTGTDPELEGDISGLATRRAVRVVATMKEGPPLEVETQIAPAALRKRVPWLRGLEFFDQWYPKGREVKRLVAYGRSGQIIGTYP